jgi:hypothetical protein
VRKFDDTGRITKKKVTKRNYSCPTSKWASNPFPFLGVIPLAMENNLEINKKWAKIRKN